MSVPAAPRIALRLAIVAAAAGVLMPAASAGPAPPPPITGVDVVTGKPVDATRWAGKPLVVNVWASWCGGCITEARDLEAFARRHPGIALVGVDAKDARADALTFLRHFGFSHPSIFDPQGTLAKRLGVVGMPTTFFLDRRHRIVASVVGAGTLARFEAALARATRG